VPGARVAPAVHEVVAFRDGAAVDSGELGAVRSRIEQRAGQK
jgi:hypothetical protein